MKALLHTPWSLASWLSLPGCTVPHRLAAYSTASGGPLSPLWRQLLQVPGQPMVGRLPGQAGQAPLRAPVPRAGVFS